MLQSLASTTNKQRSDLQQIMENVKENEEQFEKLQRDLSTKCTSLERVEGELLEVTGHVYRSACLRHTHSALHRLIYCGICSSSINLLPVENIIIYNLYPRNLLNKLTIAYRYSCICIVTSSKII